MRKWILRLLALIVVIIVGGVAFFVITWSNPAAAQTVAVNALTSTAGVTVKDLPDQIAFIPASPATTGLIFYPGAKVAPAAYAEIMHAIAEKGYAVFIIKVPFNMALLGVNNARAIMTANSAIKSWAVGGHSLGGVAAASFAAANTDVKGLLFYASYPANSMADKTNLSITSISASNDGLATRAKITDSKALLPSTTDYVVIDGGNHAGFGDYGAQDGDSAATISREEQAQQVIAASLSLLDKINP